MNNGDIVIMVNCYEADVYKGKQWACNSEEWKCGKSTVVKLEGKTGGFDTSCLRLVRTKEQEEQRVKNQHDLMQYGDE